MSMWARSAAAKLADALKQSVVLLLPDKLKVALKVARAPVRRLPGLE